MFKKCLSYFQMVSDEVSLEPFSCCSPKRYNMKKKFIFIKNMNFPNFSIKKVFIKMEEKSNLVIFTIYRHLTKILIKLNTIFEL